MQPSHDGTSQLGLAPVFYATEWIILSPCHVKCLVSYSRRVCMNLTRKDFLVTYIWQLGMYVTHCGPIKPSFEPSITHVLTTLEHQSIQTQSLNHMAP